MWGYAKDRIYADEPLTLEHLKTNFRQIMAEIPLNVSQEVVDINLERIWKKYFMCVLLTITFETTKCIYFVLMSDLGLESWLYV